MYTYYTAILVSKRRWKVPQVGKTTLAVTEPAENITFYSSSIYLQSRYTFN
jgi:hypothetical protein